MRDLDNEITRVAVSHHPVLLTGESGTGKTRAAQLIHTRSRRSRDRFVEINCAALPESLVESELFGFEKGAFTGATQRKKGLFEIANAGSLFLDEIGELRPELQAKLLKTIDEGKFRRLGGTVDIVCDVRIIAASSRSLPKMIATGTFREDFYYRVGVFELNIPPLRERPQDISEIVYSRLAVEQSSLGKREPLQIDEVALAELLQYQWPGNIRQLQNVIARLACYANTNTISRADVRAEVARFKHVDNDIILLPKSCSTLFPNESLQEFSARVRGALIEAVRSREHGNMSRVAERLSIDRSSLIRIALRITRARANRLNNSSRSHFRQQSTIHQSSCQTS